MFQSLRIIKKEKFLSLIKIYRNLISAGGVKLALEYFLECHLFDLQNRVETHRIVEKKDMKVESVNFGNSLMYMVSWTSTLRNAFSRIEIMNDHSDFDFVDIGCGKGKASFVARQMRILGKGNINYYGIDFDINLVNLAKKNSQRIFGDEGKFMVCDITKVNWADFKDNLILYMYNPFDSKIMNTLLDKISNKNLIVVYVNPQELSTFQNWGFKRYYYVESWHANLSYAILVKLGHSR